METVEEKTPRMPTDTTAKCYLHSISTIGCSGELTAAGADVNGSVRSYWGILAGARVVNGFKSPWIGGYIHKPAV